MSMIEVKEMLCHNYVIHLLCGSVAWKPFRNFLKTVHVIFQYTAFLDQGPVFKDQFK